MRMAPNAFLKLRDKRGTASLVKKKPAARVVHLSAPLKGLSNFALLNEADPLKASILTNWTVDDDRITVRPGFIKVGEITGNPAISTMIPYYGEPQRLAAAAGGGIYDLSGALLDDGYGGDNWGWASYTDLGDADYTILVNGFDGVVSWDGTAFVVEAVTVPTAEPWIVVDKFDKVLSHMNRLWFADSSNLAIYSLPLQQKSGEVELFPLSALFKQGGHIVALATWTVDGGRGMDDQLVIFTSNGECAIYSGIDTADLKLVGVFRFDAPMSKHSVVNYGGDLYVMLSSGFVPMTTLIRAEAEKLGKADLNVMSDFESTARVNRALHGWEVILNHATGHTICNMPIGGGKYQQMVRHMHGDVWSKWLEVPSRCWGWIDNHTYFGSEDGKIYRGGKEYLNDDGLPINADVRFAWSGYKSVAKKHFKMARLYVITDGFPRPFIDIEVDYNNKPPTNQPEVSVGDEGGALWDVAEWDTSAWASSPVPVQNWQGVTGLGRVGAPRVRVAVLGCSFAITGLDVVYELGGLM